MPLRIKPYVGRVIRPSSAGSPVPSGLVLAPDRDRPITKQTIANKTEKLIQPEAQRDMQRLIEIQKRRAAGKQAKKPDVQKVAAKEADRIARDKQAVEKRKVAAKKKDVEARPAPKAKTEAPATKPAPKKKATPRKKTAKKK